MKKFLMIIMLFGLPALASCPIDENASGETVCTTEIIRQPYNPSFSQTTSNVQGLSSPQPTHPLDNSNLGSKVRNFSGGNNGAYNSNCQFGVCLPDRNRPLFLQSGQND